MPRPVTIPLRAKEVVRERSPNGSKCFSEYFFGGKLVGRRCWWENGRLHIEESFRNGIKHGIERHWYQNGRLMWQTNYDKGLEHGIARQWGRKGEFLGGYRMRHGTGVDLWWDLGVLAEERHVKNGLLHGFERWWTEGVVWEESHWQAGEEHGIRREWRLDESRRLRPGYPHFFIRGKRVRKAEYLRRQPADLTLPPYRAADNKPERPLPRVEILR